MVWKYGLIHIGILCMLTNLNTWCSVLRTYWLGEPEVEPRASLNDNLPHDMKNWLLPVQPSWTLRTGESGANCLKPEIHAYTFILWDVIQWRRLRAKLVYNLSKQLFRVTSPKYRLCTHDYLCAHLVWGKHEMCTCLVLHKDHLTCQKWRINIFSLMLLASCSSIVQDV